MCIRVLIRCWLDGIKRAGWDAGWWDMEEHEKTVALVNWENVTPVTLGLLLLTIM